jgi:N-acetylmuramoyl-L-alanine amidase
MVMRRMITGRCWLGVFAILCLLPVAPASAVSFRGLSLNDLMAAYGFIGPPSEYGRSIVFRSRTATVVFEAGSRRVTFNGLTLYLNRSVEKTTGAWLIAPVDAADTLGALCFPGRALKSVGSGTVVIDAGHGGNDPGTQGVAQHPEKAFTLDIAKRVRAKLRACQVTVWLTRDRDTFVSLEERCWRGKKLGGDVFVSIHFNATRNPAISGIETFIIPAAGCPTTAEDERRRSSARVTACPGNRFDGANAVLAHYLQKGLLAHSRSEDRGIRRARFYVIRNASCPAALVECGFLSNPRELARIANPDYRDQLAEGMARGILTYLSRVREMRLPPVNP